MQIEEYTEILPPLGFPLLAKLVDFFCSFLFGRSLSFSPLNESSYLKSKIIVFPNFNIQQSCLKKSDAK